MRTLNGFAMAFLCGKDASIRNIEKILELFRCFKLAKIGMKRTGIQFLESVFEN